MNQSAAIINTPDAAYREEWRRFEHDPGPLLFLLGCQRSGTTWLHLQLARSGAFRYLSAYDVQAADRLVYEQCSGQRAQAQAAFAERLRAAAQDRGIDAIPAAVDTPEEYGLVIGDGSLRYDRPDTTPATLPLLQTLCAKKALLEGTAQPLLLKSPPDFPDALPLLRQHFPQARYIALQRHPLRILQSQLLAWRALTRQRNPYLALVDASYRRFFADQAARLRLGLLLHSRAGIEWLADCILRAQLGFLQQQEAWDDAGSLLVLRYEDLCADQVAGFAQMSAFLGLTLQPPAQAPAPRDTALLPEVCEVFATRRAAFAPVLQRYGYAAELSA